nr:unnamed protein product [Naegleria fowleri]
MNRFLFFQLKNNKTWSATTTTRTTPTATTTPKSLHPRHHLPDGLFLIGKSSLTSSSQLVLSRTLNHSFSSSFSSLHSHQTLDYHTCTFSKKKSNSSFKSLLLKDDKISPLDQQLLKTHIKNYKKIQKQQLKIQEKESKKKQRDHQFDKQLSRLGLKRDQLQLGKLTAEDYEYLMKHQVKDMNLMTNSTTTPLTLSSLIGNKLKDKSSLERKHYRFSIIDERLRTQIRITNVHIGNDQRTIYVKWMRLKGFLHAQDHSDAITLKDDLDYELKRMNPQQGMYSPPQDDDSSLMDHENSSPEIYHLEKLNHLLTTASGFLTSHLTQALGLKYAPKLIFSPIVTNVQELEYAPPSIQQKYESILELKRTYELVNGCECDPMQLVVEQLECDEFMADQPLEKKKKNSTQQCNNSQQQKNNKYVRRRRPLSPFTF